MSFNFMNEPALMVRDWINIIFGRKKVSIITRIFFIICIPLIPSCFIGWCIAELMMT